MSKKDEQANALRGSLPRKKNLDGNDIDNTTKKVYKQATSGGTKKTSIDLDELTFKRLKYIAMMESTSMKELITQGIDHVNKSRRGNFPQELKG